MMFDINSHYVFNSLDKFMLNVGILLNIDWMKKNENSDM